MGLSIQHIIISGSGLGLGLLLVSLGAGLGWGLFPDLVRDTVIQNGVLTEGAQGWNHVATPTSPRLNIYFFHLNNPDDVIRGHRPNLTEMGPYVYDLVKENTNIDGRKETVSYRQTVSLRFNQELSGSLTLENQVRTLNTPLMGMILHADQANSVEELTTINNKDALTRAFQKHDEQNKLFPSYTVDQLMTAGSPILCPKNPRPFPDWHKLCQLFETKDTPTLRPVDASNDLLFSYFHHRDGRRSAFTLDTGTKDAGSLGNILSWNGASNTDYWGESQCDVIRGTDGTIFPPFLTRNTRPDLFAPEFCRSLTTSYAADTSYDGTPGMRFAVDSTQLASVTENPDNFCYCAPGTGCLLDGVIDMQPCTNSPVVLTFPHLYQAAERYASAVDGLTPDMEKHQTFYDIEPKSGTVLRSAKRYQYNMMLKPIDGITAQLPETLLPLLWVEEVMEVREEELAFLRETSLLQAKQLNDTRWSLIGVGIGIFVVGAVLLFTFWVRN